jgi:hypothetical protein
MNTERQKSAMAQQSDATQTKMVPALQLGLLKFGLALMGAGLLGVVFFAWQTPAMALVLSAIRTCL